VISQRQAGWRACIDPSNAPDQKRARAQAEKNIH
jgi:hypothetical protein